MRQHISVAQLAGFFLANLCGMVIVLLSIQFYKDVLPVFTQGDSFMKKDYVIVSKQVSTLGSLVGKGGTFSRADIADMESQPFAKRTGAFTPAQFQVSAGMGMAGMQLSTAMFFESVPDEFVDVRLEGWTYREGQTEIPIIIPRNYLNLYNFGFAQSRNLPQLSEGVMGMMTLDVRLSGRGRTERMKGRIVGFSNRLNTILVPQAFMDWANATLGDGGETAPSRLIVEVDNPADDRIAKYFKQKGYETEGDKLDAGKTTWFLKMVVGIVLTVGLIISVLSFYLLMYDELLPNAGVIASYLPAAASDAYGEASEFYGGQAVYKDIVEFAGKVPGIDYGAYYSDIRSALTDAITNVVQNGADVETEIQNAQDTVEFNISE